MRKHRRFRDDKTSSREQTPTGSYRHGTGNQYVASR